jgi:hypothetical protein
MNHRDIIINRYARAVMLVTKSRWANGRVSKSTKYFANIKLALAYLSETRKYSETEATIVNDVDLLYLLATLPDEKVKIYHYDTIEYLSLDLD